MDNQKQKVEIDLVDLFFFFRKKLWVLFVGVLVFAILGACYTNFFVQDYYTAKTRMYVLTRSSDSELSSSDYNLANFMVKDYQVLITGENVTREVISRLSLPMSVGQLAGKISVTAIDNTRVLQIVVEDTYPDRAAAIANCVREVSSEQIKQIMAVDAVNLVYEAEVPSHKTGPNLTTNTILAAIIGLVLTVLVLLTIYLMDDTIRTDEDVSRHLGLSTLGVIPISKELETVSNLGIGVQRKKRGANLNLFIRKIDTKK